MATARVRALRGAELNDLAGRARETKLAGALALAQITQAAVGARLGRRLLPLLQVGHGDHGVVLCGEPRPALRAFALRAIAGAPAGRAAACFAWQLEADPVAAARDLARARDGARLPAVGGCAVVAEELVVVRGAAVAAIAGVTVTVTAAVARHGDHVARAVSRELVAQAAAGARQVLLGAGHRGERRQRDPAHGDLDLAFAVVRQPRHIGLHRLHLAEVLQEGDRDDVLLHGVAYGGARAERDIHLPHAEAHDGGLQRYQPHVVLDGSPALGEREAQPELPRRRVALDELHVVHLPGGHGIVPARALE
jgi:hypothetical protein